MKILFFLLTFSQATKNDQVTHNKHILVIIAAGQNFQDYVDKI